MTEVERCRNGHPKTKTNGYLNAKGTWVCRLCRSVSKNRAYAKKKKREAELRCTEVRSP